MAIPRTTTGSMSVLRARTRRYRYQHPILTLLLALSGTTGPAAAQQVDRNSDGRPPDVEWSKSADAALDARGGSLAADVLTGHVLATPTDVNSALLSGWNDQARAGFEENKGQVRTMDGAPAPFVRYRLHSDHTDIFLLNNGIAYQFNRKVVPVGHDALRAEAQRDPTKRRALMMMETQATLETYRMDMVLENADPSPRISVEGESTGTVNYPEQELYGIHQYQRVTYHDVYPGIDMVYYILGNGLKYDLIVHPGADPDLIKMRFEHQEELSVDGMGRLVHGNRMGRFIEEAPVCYQGAHRVNARFALDHDVLSFKIEPYDKRTTLTIDPARIWATYVGGNLGDQAYSCATDATGNVYVSGWTSSNTGIAIGGHDLTLTGNVNAFLIKMNSGGTRLWATYYGGTPSYAWTIGEGCAVDPNGDVYMAGSTGATSDIASGGHQGTYAGGGDFEGSGFGDSYLVKFTSAGVRVWATYYGGSGYEEGHGCATDASGNVYLCGTTSSAGAIASAGHLNALPGTDAGFLVKFSSTGTRQWGTYYGGAGYTDGSSCATDAAGNVYLAGYTNSTSGIASSGHQNTAGGDNDVYLVKFNAAGTRQWATYYGGTLAEYDASCATDAAGNVYLSGTTTSTGSIASGGFKNTASGAEEAFLVKFTSAGTRSWATYYGGTSSDYGTSCATDANGTVYLVGTTSSSSGISTTGSHQTALVSGGWADTYMVQFGPAGDRLWGTYFGGTGNDEAVDCAADPAGLNCYIFGKTGNGAASSTGLASGGFDNTFSGTTDGFLGKFSGQAPAAPGSVNVSGCTGAGNVTGATTLGAAIAGIALAQPGANIVVDILGNTTESAGTITIGAGTWNSLLIRPQGGVARTVTAATTAGSPMIDLNGADNVTINGLNTGGNALSIINTTVAATAGTSTIRFIEGATNNTVTNCTVSGSSTGLILDATGTIFFSTSTVASGNSNNTISNNNIGPAGSNLPSKAIMALGGTNSNVQNTISNNTIFDFFNPTGALTGISLQSTNNNWTISDNRLYQTAPRTFTAANMGYYGIYVASSTGYFTITGNTIGFGAANGTGTTTISGLDNTVRGIYCQSTSTTTPTGIHGNVISGIVQNTSKNLTTALTGAFSGIVLGASDGLFNCGGVTGNTIGSANGSSSIVVNSSSTTASTTQVIGIHDFSLQGNTISNNTIGYVTIQGTGTTVGFRGIRINTATGVTATTNANTITNITDTQVGSYSVYGISVALPNLSATGNTIRDLNANANTASSVVMSGIFVSSGSTGANTISGNTVHSLTNNGGNANNSIYAMDLSFPATANIVERNNIHSIVPSGTNASCQAWGIFARAGTADYRNNMIRLGRLVNGSSLTLGSSIIGIRDNAGGTNNYYHNSIYIGGTNVVAFANTFCFYSDVVNVTRTIRNNIFWNARSNASGTIAHVAMRLEGTIPGPVGLTCDHNVLHASGANGYAVGNFNGLFQLSLGAWRIATGLDVNSRQAAPPFSAPDGSAASGSLYMFEGFPSLVESAGFPVPSVTVDLYGTDRATNTPVDIGAQAGLFLPDQDGDGIADASDNCPTTANTDQANSDGDSAGNLCDGCPNDPNKLTTGVCGCGVADVAATYYADADGDGFGAGVAIPGFTCAPPGNTVTNNTDGCPDDMLKQAPGVCGCGIADVAATYYADADGDGFGAGVAIPGFTCAPPANTVMNNTDGCPSDILKQAPGACGCGVVDTDSDNDGIPNCNDNCPNTAGVQGSACDADPGVGVVPGTLNGSCACLPNGGCTENVTVELRTDELSSQASWQILAQGTNTVLCQYSVPIDGITGPIPQDCCLPVGCYRLRVTDSGGDGFVSGGVAGGYQLRETNGAQRRIIDNTGNFNDLPGGPQDISALANTYDNGAFCVPIGDNKPVFQHCDKLDWPNDQLTALVATEDPAVSASWSISASPSDKGYEFWWFDPNGTYSFRRFRSHSASDGYSPANAQRACKVKINGWANTPTSPWLQVGVLYNVRIRARYGTANYSPFGPACLFKINPAAAACPVVRLQDNPANTADYSCGVTRTFGGGNNAGINMNSALPGSAANWGNKIVANPPQPIPAVASANVRYQFRFTNDGEYPAAGSCIIRPPQTSPTIYLNWTTGNKLQCGVDYAVDVRVSLDGGATWCVGGNTPTPSTTQNPRIYWGPVCTVRIRMNNNAACPVNGFSIGTSSMSLENDPGGDLIMYPNPNRGDQLFIALSEVGTDVNAVSVYIYDMTGKRVTARTVPVQYGDLKTALDLHGELSGGMYMINITAGDKTFTERLVIQP